MSFRVSEQKKLRFWGNLQPSDAIFTGSWDNDKVDISDIVAIINVIASGNANTRSDVNGDKKTDISDIVAVINIIAGK